MMKQASNLILPFLLVLLSSFLSPALYAQYSLTYTHSSTRGYVPTVRGMVVNEEFDQPSNTAWRTSAAGEPFIQSENGKYLLAAPAYSDLQHWLELPLGQGDDYELDISLALHRPGMSLSNSYGFIFGTKSGGARMAFTMGSEGQFAVQELDSRGDGFIWDWQQAEELVPYRFQQFIVRKVDNRVSFVVDGHTIYQWQQEGLTGSRVGILVSEGASVLVDHLRVMRLSSNGYHSEPNRPLSIDLVLTEPDLDWTNGDPLWLTESSIQMISGQLTPVDNWTALLVNDQPVYVRENGSFDIDLPLASGPNRVNFEIILRDGQKIDRQLDIHYFPKTETAPTVQQPVMQPQGIVEVLPSTDLGRVAPQFQAPANIGRNFLVLIGVNSYDNWNDLHNAVKDCEDIARELVEAYQFEPEYVIRLYNEQATREGILDKMEWLQEELTPEDNLLIYYAGHGYYDQHDRLGYWVPADARRNRVPDYIPNSTIHDYLSTIDCFHTFLIADACYAGTLLGHTRGYLNPSLKSRWVFASGDVERVFDGAPGTNSPFAKSLVRYLRNRASKGETFTADQMIADVTAMVQSMVDQTPVGSPLLEAGDGGGVFMFVPEK